MRAQTLNDLPPAVTAADLARLRERLTVLDVRTPAEFESEHIPGSYNIPLDELPKHAQQLQASLCNPVVLVCRSGQRASQAEQALRAANLDGLHVLSGGIGAWEGSGQPLVRGKQRWSMERQVRGVAGGLVLLGTVASIWKRPAAALAGGVGAGLLISALTNTCTMAKVLAKLPYNRAAPACDVQSVITELAQQRSTAAAD